MTAREWLNVFAILESIDEVPGMPVPMGNCGDPKLDAFVQSADRKMLNAVFRESPVRFLRRADDATRAAIWAEVERRLAGGA